MNKQEVIQSTSDPVLFARVFSEYINQDIFDLCFAINFYKRNKGFFQSHMNIELIEHLEDLGFNGENEGDWVIMSMNNVTFNFSL